MIISLIVAIIIAFVECSFLIIFRYQKIRIQNDFDVFKKDTEREFKEKNEINEDLISDISFIEEKSKSDLAKSDEEHEKQLLELEDLFKDKVKEFQEIVNEYESYFKYYEKYFDSIVDIIKISDARIKQIDTKGSFKSDDEIGFFFQNIQEIQTTLNEFNLSRPAFKAPEPKKLIKTEDGLEIPEGSGYISAEQVSKILNK